MPDELQTDPPVEHEVRRIAPLDALNAGGAAPDGLSVEWLMDRLLSREDRR